MRRPENHSIRVAFCDDAAGFPLLLTAWIRDMDGVELVGSASVAPDLLALLPRARPDVVLLDLLLPGGAATGALLDEIRGCAPGARIILMSSLRLPALQEQADSLGADGVWSKAAGSDALRTVLRTPRDGAPGAAELPDQRVE